MRTIEKVYHDPLDVIWTDAARQLGMRIVRSSEVFASWDGQGVLTIGSAETLDQDDSLAQMILHETCHALCEAPQGLALPDWGLRSDRRDQRIREHACLRLQAALADAHGLRKFFSATTVFRPYYDRIPAMALEDDGDPSVPIARAAWERAMAAPWATPLQTALSLTAQIRTMLAGRTQSDSIWD